MDSGAWGDLLVVGGEHVQDLASGGRKHPNSTNGRSSANINDPAARRQRQQHEDLEELVMPRVPPFRDCRQNSEEICEGGGKPEQWAGRGD